MSYVSSSPPVARRVAVFVMVAGAHIGLLLLSSMMAKTVLPQAIETPLVVDLVDAMPAPPVAKAHPSPVRRPPMAQKQAAIPPPRIPQTAPETTSAAGPAPGSAPVLAADAAPKASVGGAGGDASGEAPLVPARFDADVLQNPPPPYPGPSRRLGEEGRTVLRVRVSAAGVAETVEIRTSSGSARLDDSAQRTVRTWRFLPARRGGTSVDSWVLVPIVFKLEQ